MTQCTSITSLYLYNCRVKTDTQWRRLPPKLQDLQIGRVTNGPPAFTDGSSRQPLLDSLLRVGIASDVPINALTQLLHAAPNLDELKDDLDRIFDHHPTLDEQDYVMVDCSETHSRPDDFLVLLKRGSLYSINNATYRFHGNSDLAWGSWNRSSVAVRSLPGFLSCIFALAEIPDLQQLLRAFPDVENLALRRLGALDDVQLQMLVASASLKRLVLERCNKISTMGLVLLCARLPSLCYVRCVACDGLTGPGLDLCSQLLMRDSLLWEHVA